jgi:putative FmdB family regulatory protein
VPLYEYQCGRCGRFERIQKFSDPTLSACPTCGQPVEKLVSSPAIQFKGSGWYITDYARKGNGSESGKGEAKADAPKSDGGKDGSSKATDSTSSSPQSSTSKDSSASGSSSSK